MGGSSYPEHVAPSLQIGMCVKGRPRYVTKVCVFQVSGRLWCGTWRDFMRTCRTSRGRQRRLQMAADERGVRRRAPQVSGHCFFCECECGADIGVALQGRASAGGRCAYRHPGRQARGGCASEATGQAADERAALACPHAHVVGASRGCSRSGHHRGWHEPHFRVGRQNH